MENMVECLKFERFCFEELESWGSRPLRVLADAMINEDGPDQKSQTDHWALCNILWERVHELDEACKRLVREESEALRAKREAALV